MPSANFNHEMRILRALVEAMTAAGFKPAAVWTQEIYVVGVEGRLKECDPGEEADRIDRPLTVEEVLQVFKDYDLGQPTVHFTHKDQDTWGNRGVLLCHGNGRDFISDWHCGDKDFHAVAEDVATKASEERI